jgi:hypothetical protein
MHPLKIEIQELLARIEKLESKPRGGAVNMVQAARYLGLSEETLRREHARGKGPRRSRRGSRGWSYAYHDLDRWLLGRQTESAASRQPDRADSPDAA